LQNGDGGFPTFCRGWGHLPFDRSSADISAHALRSLHAWKDDLPFETISAESAFSQRVQGAMQRGLRFLSDIQRVDGSWVPLWFGNQYAPGDENPTYGTTRVLAAYRDLDLLDSEPARRGLEWLISAQCSDGGWGGAPNTPPSVEETALAVDALIGCGTVPGAEAARTRGLNWLVERVEDGSFSDASPIGFYFAKLWYFEQLYPVIFTVGALGRALKTL